MKREEPSCGTSIVAAGWAVEPFAGRKWQQKAWSELAAVDGRHPANQLVQGQIYHPETGYFLEFMESFPDVFFVEFQSIPFKRLQKTGGVSFGGSFLLKEKLGVFFFDDPHGGRFSWEVVPLI